MKWDENSTFYKKFSQRIEETLEAYKQHRISEAEYFAAMQCIRRITHRAKPDRRTFSRKAFAITTKPGHFTANSNPS